MRMLFSLSLVTLAAGTYSCGATRTLQENLAGQSDATPVEDAASGANSGVGGDFDGGPAADSPTSDASSSNGTVVPTVPALSGESSRENVSLVSRADVRACVGFVGHADGNVGLWSCSHDAPVNYSYTPARQFRHVAEGQCLTATLRLVSGKQLVDKAVCATADTRQTWTYDGNRLRNDGTGLCLDLAAGRSSPRTPLLLAPCTDSVSQGWYPPVPIADTVYPQAQATSVRQRSTPVIYLDDQTATDDANRRAFYARYPDLQEKVVAAVQDVGATLFASPNDVPTSRVYLHVRLTDEPSYLAAVGDYYMSLGVKYFVEQYDRNNAIDLDGVLRHELTHFFHHGNNGTIKDTPGWVIEGFADYVRIVTGYIPMSERRKGGYYTEPGRRTEFFFLYLDQTYPGIMRKLYKYSTIYPEKSVWDPEWFRKQTGKSLDQMWQEYQATL